MNKDLKIPGEGSLILLRGLPGAGKTTFARLLADNRWPILAIDDFFTDPVTSVYTFRYEQNHLAYRQCETDTEKELAAGTEKVFVDNTFTMSWEMEPYFKLAKKYKYRIFVVTVENYHGNSNIHGIPEENLQKMAAKYQVRLL
jgi:predicted kinase